jgi:hypothetical protein
MLAYANTNASMCFAIMKKAVEFVFRVFKMTINRSIISCKTHSLSVVLVANSDTHSKFFLSKVLIMHEVFFVFNIDSK